VEALSSSTQCQALLSKNNLIRGWCCQHILSTFFSSVLSVLLCIMLTSTTSWCVLGAINLAHKLAVDLHAQFWAFFNCSLFFLNGLVWVVRKLTEHPFCLRRFIVWGCNIEHLSAFCFGMWLPVTNLVASVQLVWSQLSCTKLTFFFFNYKLSLVMDLHKCTNWHFSLIQQLGEFVDKDCWNWCKVSPEQHQAKKSGVLWSI